MKKVMEWTATIGWISGVVMIIAFTIRGIVAD